MLRSLVFFLGLIGTLLLSIIHKKSSVESHGFESITNEDLIKITKLAESGDAAAQNKLGWLYDQGILINKDVQGALKWYLESANQGFKQAQINLGVMYELGRGVNRDLDKAEEWCLKAECPPE